MHKIILNLNKICNNDIEFNVYIQLYNKTIILARYGKLFGY